MAAPLDEERIHRVQEGHVTRRPELVGEDVGCPSVLPLRRFFRDRREARDRLGPIDIRHAGERVAMVDRNRERAVPIVLHVLLRDRIEDRVRGPGSPKDFGHEREADPFPDFPGEGRAD